MWIEKIRNKLMTDRFQFLIPKSNWTGEPPEDYDYSYTELDAMPKGWRSAFGIQLCEELKQAIEKDHLDEYQILEIKEKFGELRWYDCGGSENTYKVIKKYEDLSRTTCIDCGKPATRISKGWISPYCDKCIKDNDSVDINEFYKGGK